MSAYGYIRVSTDEQGNSGLGLDAQRARIEGYCLGRGLPLVRVFEDPGVSGGKSLSSRVAGAELLRSVGKGDVVIAAKLDRLFRSVVDAAGTIAEFVKRGIELVAVSEGFDMTSMYGRAMAQMASVFAELEREMIRERTREAMSVKRKRGERISRIAPYGWSFSGKSLAANDQEQKIKARIRDLREQGTSLQGIANILNAEQVPTKQGKPWIHTTIRSILKRA